MTENKPRAPSGAEAAMAANARQRPLAQRPGQG